MLTKRYMAGVKNLSAILDKIVSGTAPGKFTTDHLKNIGFPSSNDRSVIPLLKDLGFLSSDGVPTKRYHDYRNAAQSKRVLGEALREVYEELFHINAKPSKSDREAIEGTFKSVHNVGDRVAELQAMTFFALLDKADLKETHKAKQDIGEIEVPPKPVEGKKEAVIGRSLQLRHNIEVHLPTTKDIEVYNAIFKSLKEHLVD